MDNIKFNDMKVGGQYNTVALLQAVTEKVAKNGKPFVELELSDGAVVIIARQFDCCESELIINGIRPEIIVYATIKVDVYRGIKNYTVIDIIENPFPDASIDDFIIKAPIDFDKAWATIIKAVDKSHKVCEDDLKYVPIKELVLKILNDYKSEIMHSAAGKTIHHNYVGGLLQHTYEMVCEAMITSLNYDNLDGEILICGTVLHDIGKLWEMKTSPLGHVEYTPEGRLLGHAAIGMQIVDEYAKFALYDSERVRLIKHMIASHHGQLEMGAIVEPAIPEAVVLNAIDMIDSRMNIFSKAYTEIDSGEMSGNIYALGNCSVYKPDAPKQM